MTVLSAGFRKAVKELGIQGKVIECKYDAANYVPYLAAAAKNFDMVFVVGFEIVDALAQVAPQFPKTEFVQMDMSGKIAHVSFVNFKENEGSFPCRRSCNDDDKSKRRSPRQ